MRRKLNPRYISSFREYTFKEISKIYGRNINTVRKWPEQGLRVLEGPLNPILVLGSDLLDFIKERDKKCKRPIKEGEFYCTRCNSSRTSVLSEIKFISLDKITGKGKKQFRIIGICEICACRLNRIANEDQLKSFKICTDKECS